MNPPKSAPSGAPPAMTSAAPSRVNAYMLALIPALAAAVLYLPILQYGWVWDDVALVTSHATKSAAAQAFHPAVGALYRLEWLVGIGNPAFYHLVSLALHLIGTWLFFLLILGAGAGTAVALGASILFAAHPIHTEAVAYISGRPDLLATVCALGALVVARSAPVCTPEGCRSWRVWLAYLLLAIAVLSDEVALVTPLLLIGLDRFGSPRVAVSGRKTVYWGFTAVAIAGLLARIGAHQLRLNEPHELMAPGTGIWGPIVAAYEYLKAMVVPHPLNAIRSLSVEEAARLRLLALGTFAAVAFFVFLRRKDPLARTGALLLVLPLIPALPLGPFQGAYVEERAAYFASVGFCFLAASVFSLLAGGPGARTGIPRRAAAVVIALAAAAFAGALTMNRLPVWSSNVALLQDAARHDPRDPAPHLALADQYLNDGNVQAALDALDHAIAIDSTQALAYHKRTLILNRIGHLPEAEASARRAVQLQPGEAVFWANLGDLLNRQGRTREANEANSHAVRLDPKNADNWYNYGVSLAASDSLQAAIAAYRQAVAINPGHFQALNNLGASLAISGRIAEAKDVYEKAVELQPTSLEAHMNLTLAYLQLGDIPAANHQRELVQKFDPMAAGRMIQLIRQFQPGQH